MEMLLIKNRVLVLLLILLFFSCNTNTNEGNSESTSKTDKAYMSQSEWDKYHDFKLGSSSNLQKFDDASKCTVLELKELLKLYKESNRHEWLSQKDFKLFNTASTKSTGDVKKDITNYSNLWYKKCYMDYKDVISNKGGGKIGFKATSSSDVSYTIDFKNYVIAGKKFNQLSEIYDDELKKVIYHPTKNTKNSSNKIYFIDDIFIFLSNGQSKIAYTLSKDPSVFVKNWKKEWKEGLYEIQ